MLDDVAFITEETNIKMSNTIVESNDILLNITGGSLGRSTIFPEKLYFANVSQHVTIIRLIEKSSSKYLHLAILSPYIQSLIWGRQVGANREGLSKRILELFEFPLPPLPEQHRIVAKVDELMALCDQLEQQQTENNQLHQTLVETLLANLTQANSPAEQQEAWQRIANHFDTLFYTEYSIDQLKQTILQLAVMGKLVPQDRTDEPASELLKRIAKEKARLVKEGKIKKQAPLPEITDDEKPFELPKGWEFAKMETICTLITDGTHLTPRYTEGGRPFISAQNIKPFKFMPENHRLVSEEDYQGYIQNRKPEKGDILLTRVGAGIGEAAVINIELDFAIYVSVGLLKFSSEYISADYLVTWLNSPIGRDHSERNTYGKGVSQGNLNLSLIRNFPVSIPPLAEQHRIVAKVDELFALCDALKERLAQAQTTQNLLAETVVAQALGSRVPKFREQSRETTTRLKTATPYSINEHLDIAAEP